MKAEPDQVERLGRMGLHLGPVGDIVRRLEQRLGVDGDAQVAGDRPLVRPRQLGRAGTVDENRLSDQRV